MSLQAASLDDARLVFRRFREGPPGVVEYRSPWTGLLGLASMAQRKYAAVSFDSKGLNKWGVLVNTTRAS